MDQLNKIPPQNLDMERAILGAVILEKNAMYEVIDILKHEVFYSQAHQKIYKALIEIHNAGGSIDILTVTNKLRSNKDLDEIGGAYYLSSLIDNIGSASHIAEHARIIYEFFLRREVIRIGHDRIKQAYDDSIDIFKNYNETVTELNNTFSILGQNEYSHLDVVAMERLEEISKISETTEIVGMNTGYVKLNRATNGFQPGDFIILAARPSMGKTVNALKVGIACMERDNKPVLMFSLEMNKKRIADRALSILSGIDSMRISSNKLTNEERIRLKNAAKRLHRLIIIDNRNLKINEIRNRAIVLNRTYDFGLIILDYIQLVPHILTNKNTNDNVSHISRGLKALADDCSCPLLALSQLNRSNDFNMPELTDLRDSGSLEQDSDIVWMMVRRDYQGRECLPVEEKRIDNELKKNRNGILGGWYTYRSEDWSYIGETEYNDFLGMVENMPEF